MRTQRNILNTQGKCYNWNLEGFKTKLKYEYKNERAGEVVTYKLSKEELKEYLKKV